MEPERGKSCLSGQRRGPATPGDKRVSSSDQNPFHISTTPSTRKRKRRSPWSIPLRRLCKPQPNFLVAHRLRLIEAGRVESCLSGQHRGPATPRVDRVFPPDLSIFHLSSVSTTRDESADCPGRYPHHKVWQPHPNWLFGHWLRLMGRARGKSCPSGQRRGLAAPEEDTFSSRVRNPSISLQLQQSGDENTNPAGRYRPRRCGNPNPTGRL